MKTYLNISLSHANSPSYRLLTEREREREKERERKRERETEGGLEKGWGN